MRITALAVALLLSSSARANDCTLGDVHALFQSIVIFAHVQRPLGIDSHMVQRLGNQFVSPCQYRLWNGKDPSGAPIVHTFNAGQYFLGGSTQLWDYGNWGMTREEAVHDLQITEEHAFLVVADANWGYAEDTLAQHEIALMSTGYRGSNLRDFGLSVARQQGFIGQLPAGRYISVYTVHYPGNPALAEKFPDFADFFGPYDDRVEVRLCIGSCSQ